MICLQTTYSPKSVCFGCGPTNPKGLRIQSLVDPNGNPNDPCTAHWRPELHHEAFPGVLNGGIIGSLLDCHSNWTAAWFLMQQSRSANPPCTVTADFHVFLKRPTPMDCELFLKAWVTSSTQPDRATVEAELSAKNGKVTATCTGTFVAVKEGHPAFHRW